MYVTLSIIGYKILKKFIFQMLFPIQESNKMYFITIKRVKFGHLFENDDLAVNHSTKD